MLSFLFKPKWQHRDDAIRANAVAHLRDAELSKALPRLAVEDPSEAVRSAALERLGDRKLFLRAALEDRSESLRSRLRKRLLKDLLATTDDGTEFLALLKDADAETIERIAVDARSRALRRAALERIERAGLLADRALADADPDIRLWLADRVPVGPSLERLLDASRTRDKRVHKRVRDKLEAIGKRDGSPALIEAEALALCRKLEVLLKTVPADAGAQADAIETAWTAFGTRAPAALQARFSGTLQTLRRAAEDIYNPKPKPVVTAPEPVTEASPEVAESTAVPVVQEPTEADATLAALVAEAEAVSVVDERRIEALKARWAQRWAGAAFAVNQPLKAAFEAQLQRLRELFNTQLQERQARQDTFRHALDELAQALDAGNSKAARESELRVTALLKGHRELDQGSDGRRYGALKQQLLKLGDWQRWSSSQARVDLCTEMEALPGLGLHPDALAAKVKELQQRFNKLDQLDGLTPEQAKQQGIGRRFRALGFAALKPAKGFFEKRAEVRQRHTDDIATQISDVEALLAVEPIDVPALIARKRALSDTFRELDRTDPARRAELAKQMKTLLDRISAAIDASFENVRLEKEKLVAQLRLKIKHAPREEAIELIKSTQQRFKSAGRGQRASDQALWDELKALADPVFAAQKADRDALDQAAADQIKAQQAVVEAVQALALESAEHPGAAAARLAELDLQWRAFSPPPREPDREREFGSGAAPTRERGRDAGRNGPGGRERGRDDSRSTAPSRDMERDYLRAVEAVEQAVRAAREQRSLDKQQLLREKSAQIARIESQRLGGGTPDAAAERAQWTARSSLDDALEQRLQQRLEHALGPEEIDLGTLEANALEAQRLALLVEYLEGRPSPPAYAAARMEFQVKRLAAHMGGTGQPREQELARALEEFHLLGPLLPAVRQDVQARLGMPTA